jgi:hypothetical protein
MLPAWNRNPSASAARLVALCAGLVLAVASCSTASAQTPPSLRLGEPTPGGGRTKATESWGTFDFSLTNYSAADRLARVLVFYEGQEGVQYGRDVWVPANATLASWLLVGPAAPQLSPGGREVQMLVYERAAGKERLLLAGTEQRIRARVVPYQKRQPFTVLLRDADPPEEDHFGQLPQPPSRADEALMLALTFRAACNFSDYIHLLDPDALPPTPETFAGVDHVILASERLARYPLALWALRRWLEQGGKVWVLLDMVGADTVAALLGHTPDFRIVDRVSLTDFTIEMPEAGPGPPQGTVRHEERPMDFVRVLLPEGERPVDVVNGWPAWFTRPVGRGKVIFTTLGPRAWLRPRRRNDPPSAFAKYPGLPVPEQPLLLVADAVRLPAQDAPFPVEALRQPVAAEIGYAVVGQGTAALVFAAFLVGSLALGLVLRRSARPELFGWVVPAAALGAAGAFLTLGGMSHQAEATVAVAQVVEAVPGADEAPVHGLLAVYRPQSGPAELGARRGGFFDLDMSGVEGQDRRFVLTDLGAWHWENLDLPAGVRLATFRYPAPTPVPITAVARFGPDGLEGKLTAGPFRDVGDALLSTPGDRSLSIGLQPDGSFRAGTGDALPAGQFLASAVLTDRQQRRQDLYRQFFERPEAVSLKASNLLLAWAEPLDLHFTLAPEARTVGSALLMVPLRLERAPPGTRVTVPGPLIACRRIVAGHAVTVPHVSLQEATDLHLHFQLPAAVLPLHIERARLLAKLSAPSRRVTVSAGPPGQSVELRRVDSPIDPIRLDITEARFLGLDAQGGLNLTLAVGEAPQAGRPGGRAAAAPEGWRVEYLELEVTGRTADDKVTR